MFEPSKLEQVKLVDTIYSTSAQYTDPTNGLLDLVDLDQLSKPILPVNISVYDIEGYIDEFARDDEPHKVLEMTVEEYSGKNVISVSDVWISEEYRGVGLGTELFEFLRDEFPKLTIYLYASTVPMATIARNIGSEKVEDNWFKLVT